MKLTVEVIGLDEAMKRLTDTFSERRLNAAAATALTRTAVEVRDAVQAEMRRVFDRPTPYTMSGMRYTAASARSLEAWVGFDVERVTDIRGQTLTYTRGETPVSRYMQPQVDGGSRTSKRFERLLQMAGHLPNGWYAIPGAGARLDAYGNVSRGQIIQVLSQLRITAVSGFARNMSFGARKQISAQRKAGGRIFVMPPGKRAPPGIYIRELMGRNITPLFIFVSRAQYRQRLDLHGIVVREAATRIPAHLRREIERSASRLAVRGGR